MTLLLRRIHLYLALFLAPWILMYTASTFVMNHRSYFRGSQPLPPPRYEKQLETTYTGELPSGASPQQTAIQLLDALGMDGSHSVSQPGQDGAITINRQDPVHPLRIRYTPSTRQIVVEKMAFDTPAFLERMHRRRGFQHDYLLEDAWAFSVDLVIAAIIVWALSGLWMWWELKSARAWGAVALIGGILLFAIFLSVL